MEAKQWVFERVSQTFSLYKNNFIPLTLLYFVAMLFFELIFTNVFRLTLVWNIDIWATDIVSQIYNTQMILIFLAGVILFLIYLLALVPVNIATIRSVQQAYNEQDVTVKDNFTFAVKNFLNIIKIYWYLFVYIALIPAVLLIIWMLTILTWQLTGATILMAIGWILSWVAVFVFLIFSIYRWIKSTFAIYHAIEMWQYTKWNFEKSIGLTKNNWWRIVWNFALFTCIMIVFWAVVGFISWLLWFVGPSLDMWDLSDPNSLRPEQLAAIKDSLWSINLSIILSWIINAVITTIATVSWIVFVYLFYRAIAWNTADTSSNKNDSDKSEVKEEL